MRTQTLWTPCIVLQDLYFSTEYTFLLHLKSVCPLLPIFFKIYSCLVTVCVFDWWYADPDNQHRRVEAVWVLVGGPG